MKVSTKLFIGAGFGYLLAVGALVFAIVSTLKFKQFGIVNYCSAISLAVAATSMVYSGKSYLIHEAHDERKKKLDEEIEGLRQKAS